MQCWQVHLPDGSVDDTQKTKLKQHYGLTQLHMKKEIQNEGQNKSQAKNDLIYSAFLLQKNTYSAAPCDGHCNLWER